MVTLSEDLRARGLIHQITDEALLELLDSGGLTCYIGFDPTAESLHVGSLLQICTLRRIQLAGHRPIALAGGGTGMIGDPGGKATERPLLSLEEIASNTEAIAAQLASFLDFSERAGANQALLVNNAEWLCSLDLMSFLRDVGKHFTVNQMIAKESVKSRLDRPDRGISYTEFSYMLLQALDFAELYERHGCTVQLGGSDQWGNITLGAEYVRKHHDVQAYGLTSPLVIKADGAKFGKSEGGNDRVWLDPKRTSPYALYQFFLSTEDADVAKYLRYFTFLELEEIDELEQRTAQHPAERAAQRALAASVIELIHGEDERRRAEEASEALFGGSVASLDAATILDLIGEVPHSEIPRSAIVERPLLVELLAESGVVKSKSEARRTIEQGGAFVNDVSRQGLDATVGLEDLLFDRYLILRRGKRSYHVITAS
jgi:tyrosyl-tRNA synthetase